MLHTFLNYSFQLNLHVVVISSSNVASVVVEEMRHTSCTHCHDRKCCNDGEGEAHVFLHARTVRFFMLADPHFCTLGVVYVTTFVVIAAIVGITIVVVEKKDLPFVIIFASGLLTEAILKVVCYKRSFAIFSLWAQLALYSVPFVWLNACNAWRHLVLSLPWPLLLVNQLKVMENS